MAILFSFFAVIGIVSALIVLNGWVLSILWGWFIVPLFGLPVLSIPYAIGMALIVGMFKGQTKDLSNDDEKVAVVAKIFLFPFIALFIGWIVKGFI
jgi:hypothetical protein